MVANNVLSEGGGRGLGFSASSALGSTKNLTWLQIGNTPASTFVADPLFSDPTGPDGVLGGIGAADDDFRVEPLSPTLDTGTADARTIELALQPSLATLGTRSDDLLDGEAADLAPANLGAHSPIPDGAFASLE